MRFRSSSTPPPYLNRRDQLRMLSLVGLLALVLIAIKVTARPEFWHWLVPPQAPEQPAEVDNDRPDNSRLDFDVRFDDDDPLRPDEFLAPADSKTNQTSDAENQTPDAEEYPPETPPQELASQESASKTQEPEQPVEIDKTLLEVVRDNTLRVRSSEADAFYSVLAKARDIPPGRLQQAARDDVDFQVLMAEADRFRGKPITVQGEIKRLLKIEAGKNPYGIDAYYEAWLFFAPGSGNNPYRIVCTSIPDGIPQGERINQSVSVRVTGYFFKLEGYQSEGGLHVAPTLLANQMRRLRGAPTGVARRRDEGLWPYFIGFGVLAVAGLALTVWRFTAEDKLFCRRHVKRITEAPREAIDALSDVETTDPSDMFRQLSEQAETSEVSEAAQDSSASGADEESPEREKIE